MSIHHFAGPNFKTPNLVHIAARKNARGKQCALRLPCCRWDTETTVLAHLRMFGAAGMAEKPDDWFAVFACRHCHDALDGRSDSGLWGYEDIVRALHLTLKQQFADRVWIPGSGR